MDKDLPLERGMNRKIMKTVAHFKMWKSDI